MQSMLNQARLEELLESYKRDFTSQHWNKEKYKWRAVKHFQNNWDVKADDFAGMLKYSLSKAGNLLARRNHLPAKMIIRFAEAEPETVRAMFADLFQSGDELYTRMERFKEQSQALLKKHVGGGKHHYQNENAISTYLWLWKPDGYYIYKFTEGQIVAEALESGHQFTTGDYANNVRNFYELYDAIREELIKDEDLLALYRSHLVNDSYLDPKLRILTADVGFYIACRVYEGRSFKGLQPPLSGRGGQKSMRAPLNVPQKTTERKRAREEIFHPGRRYWWLNANPKIWSFSSLAVGETQSYTLYNDNNRKRRIFQNFLDAKAGDMVIGYESTPVKQIVAIARVSGEQDGEEIYFEKLEELLTPVDYQAVKSCPELAEMEFFRNPQGSLFKLTEDEYNVIVDLIREDNPSRSEAASSLYTEENFLDEVYMTRENYETLTGLLRNKKNVILQGAPGVGKTFAARRLAWSMMGEKDENRVEFIQFHQNYSYEDFVMGYKPAENGFELKYGSFYRFCKKAVNQPDKAFFFIIDEINRGNMSKIFGELLMLIERDYRGVKAALAYNGLPFYVPENVYIIGMMNTADRSLAMIDYALRRRFSFFEMQPGFGSDGFARYQAGLNSDLFNRLISYVLELNREISQDRSLGKGFCIGHSYFCGCEACSGQWLRSVVDYDILPTLEEYWFDAPSKVERWESILHGVFQ